MHPISPPGMVCIARVIPTADLVDIPNKVINDGTKMIPAPIPAMPTLVPTTRPNVINKKIVIDGSMMLF